MKSDRYKRPGSSVARTALLAVAVLVVGGFVASVLFPTIPAMAQEAGQAVAEGARVTGQTIGLATTDIRTYAGLVVRYFMGLLGIIAVILFMYAGFLWMTAGGRADQIEKAKKIMVNAVIGLIIIVSAYAIAMFVINALFNSMNGGGGSGSSAKDRIGSLYASSRGKSALGNGIIEYHYPEPNQTGVVRNTKIAITFKKPVVLSSLVADYDDKGTYDLCDDLVGGQPVCDGNVPKADLVLTLRPDSLRIIPVESMGEVGNGSVDEMFDNRYPIGFSVTDAKVRFTEVARISSEFNPIERQTIVIKPIEPLGSASVDMDYRVALRGGDNGVKVWSAPSTPGGLPQVDAALPIEYPDGGYHWVFTTSTVIDNTPPQLTQVVPRVVIDPTAKELDRNQLLQVYFNEAIDPTTATGKIGAGWGFNNIEVKARCRDAADCPVPFSASVFSGIDGELVIGNRYRTVEFVPAAGCGTVTFNSCGDRIFCLPGNSELALLAKAATVSNEPPAALLDNGVEDMAGNSLDGNRNTVADGPNDQAGKIAYPLNSMPADKDSYSDSVAWKYEVGDNIDLVPPMINELVPEPEPLLYPDGYNKIPGNLILSATWSKAMSIFSMRTGGFTEPSDFTDDDSTVVLRSFECEKDDLNASGCQCSRLEPPGFFLETLPETVMLPSGEEDITVLRYIHTRPFYTANELGFTEQELDACTDIIPKYVPIIRAGIRDLKQNCFWPSYYRPTAPTDECDANGDPSSCCEKVVLPDGQFIDVCKP